MQDDTIREAFQRSVARVGKNEVTCLIFTHRQADPDALCSAGAIKELLGSSFPEIQLAITIIAPQGPSILGRQVSNSLQIKYQEKIQRETILSADTIVVVDTGDPRLLEPFSQDFSESTATKILVDHHSSSLQQATWGNLDQKIVNAASTSACEIVAMGFDPEKISKRVAEILMVGLLFDSQHLGIATKNTLEAALLLVNAGADISTAKRMLRHDPDRSEVLGKIKAAQRIKYEEVGKRVMARSEISSFHASVARMLVEIGADVGLAYGETDGEARLSVRSSQQFYKETGIDLSVEVKKVCDYFGLTGGGHSTAASISGKIDSAAMLADKLVQNLKSLLPQK